jgi:hypothetical protein
MICTFLLLDMFYYKLLVVIQLSRVYNSTHILVSSLLVVLTNTNTIAIIFISKLYIKI